MRFIPFITNGYYHVYNRGVDKRKIFQQYGHYLRFLATIRSILKTGSATQRPIYNQGLALSKRIDILAYCLMPNHYHFLIKQTSDDGITNFMHKLNTSYTMFFNANNHRTGRLFEYTFKAKYIQSDEILLHVARYIHLNPIIAGLVEKPNEWKWSSYREYFDNVPHAICQRQELQSFFTSPEHHKNFIHDQLTYAQLLKHANDGKNEDALFF